MARGKLAIGFIYARDWEAPFGLSLVNTLNADWRGERRIKGRIIGVRSGAMIQRGRNQVVQAFLSHPDKPDWLLMVDSDMEWSPQDLRKLFDAADAKEAPVIGGLCFSGNAGSIWPTMLVWNGKGFSPVKKYPKETLCRVDATGAAFLLVHRSVYEKVGEAHRGPSPWYCFSEGDGVELGEDVTFCLRLRKLGIPIYVHTGVTIGHVKDRTLREEDYEAFIREAEATSYEEAEAKNQLRLLPPA